MTICLMQVKKGLFSLKEARRLAEEYDQKNKQLKDQNVEVPEYVDEETINFLNELKVKFIKQFLIEALKYENKE